jgi:hypothetical protein
VCVSQDDGRGSAELSRLWAALPAAEQARYETRAAEMHAESAAEAVMKVSDAA